LRRFFFTTLFSSLAQPAWTTSHGDVDNRGFVPVATAPASFNNQIGFADVGIVAPGANPVTAADGTVYIVNVAGQLIALHADGSAFWARQLDYHKGGIF
jgi:outer membrane protein assembly factor BamB